MIFDYLETFFLIVKLNFIHVLLSLVANLDWSLQQLDVKNAFLNRDLEEEVYMKVPPGFGEKFGTKVWKLKNYQEPDLRNSLNLLKVKDTLKGKMIIQFSSNIHKIGRSPY
ncbi:hypothetical protein CR513_01834, partial [Mucuna pruriens]